MGQTTTYSTTSTTKAANTPPESLSTMLNTLQMEEANSGFPPFLLLFEFFNYNVHKCLVDFGTAANVMPHSIAKKINAQWSETSARTIQLDRAFVPSISEL